MHHPERVGSMSGKGRPDRDDLGYHPIRMCAVPTSVLASFLSCCTLVWSPCQRISFATGISTQINNIQKISNKQIIKYIPENK